MKIIKKHPENLNTADLYKMTMSPAVKKMKDFVGAVVHVNAWIMYEDTDRSGKSHVVLSIMDNEGICRATNSPTFINDFEKMWELFDSVGNAVSAITVMSGKSKQNRDFITCVFYE